MSLSVFRRYNNIGDGLVEFSALKAGGFDPVFQNQHYAYLASLEMLALGGLIILMPDTQLEGGTSYLESLQSEPLEDYDPIPEKKYGHWIRGSVFFGLLFGIFGGVLLPIFFLPSFWLLIAGVGMIFIDNDLARVVGVSLLLVAPMLLHAKYVAIPKLRENQ